ncbi:MAG: TIGR02186 family protein [Holophagae bacterium]|jgi:uncharacterized protein (TIGR02186 family)
MARQGVLRTIAGVALAALAAAAPTPANAVDLEVSPPGVKIGAFFAGQNVELSGVADASTEIVIEIFGPKEASRFHLKGRVGPLWMNVQEVELEYAPHLYLLLTSDELGPEVALGELDLGLQHLERGIVVRPDTLDKDMIFEQFLKLKRSEGLYEERRGTVVYEPAVDGERTFRATLFLPASIGPGAYRIVTTALDGGRVVDRTTDDLWVEETDGIKVIHDLAIDHGLIYGIACVLIALVVGAIIGVVFKRVGAH